MNIKKLLLLSLIICLNLTNVSYAKEKPFSWPIDSNVSTTLDKTVVPVAVPSTSPMVLPNDISKYSQYGYGIWKTGKGLEFERRLDLMPAGYNDLTVKNSATLLHFFTMSDIHLIDIQSPAQALYLSIHGEQGMSSAYSPIIPYTTQVLDAAVQTVNVLNKKKTFDFGLLLGDAINNNQYNELRWYIDILDGKNINPNSDPKSTASTDYLKPYKAVGLDKSIPWYQVLGNHDHFWSGVFTPNDYIKQTIVGENVLNLGSNILDNNYLDSRGNYMGIIDGSTIDGKVIDVGPVSNFATLPKVNANPERHSMSKQDWITQFFNTNSTPVGHGFSMDSTKTGVACYTFEPKAKLPIKVIVLDDTERNDTVFVNHANGANGALDQQRYEWLIKELDKGQTEGKLMIVAAHVPIGVGPMWDNAASSPTESELIAKLHTYPNLILWLAGHRHLSTVTALPSPDPKHPEYGFWEVETPSLRDFCQQFRIFDIERNSDNTISIFTTNVDPSVAKGSPAFKSRSYGIAAFEIFSVGSPFLTPYNAELVKQLTPEMQKKIKNLGTSVHKCRKGRS